MEKTLRIFDNFLDDALYKECYEYSISKIGSPEMSFRTNHFWQPGIVKDSNFINLGNDAIDVSGSDIKITNVTINKAGDKGLSAGENSKMTINNVTINNSEIGLAGKDLSIVEGKNLTIRNNKLAFTAFKKKPEFGPSHIKLTKVKLDSVETIHLIENKSSLHFNGKEATTLKNVKSKMYGVEFGKSSK